MSLEAVLVALVIALIFSVAVVVYQSHRIIHKTGRYDQQHRFTHETNVKTSRPQLPKPKE